VLQRTGVGDTVEEESLNRKALHKTVLYVLKVVPMVIAGICLVNTTLSYYDIDLSILSYIVFWLMLSFLYIASYAFRFCKYHRMFLHYVAVSTILCSIDYEWGLPIEDWEYLILHFIIAGIFLFLVLYYHEKEKDSVEAYR